MSEGEKGKLEFLSEAEEIIEALGRDLVLLDESLRVGPPDPDIVNDIFRSVHTMKGLAGLFGATTISQLTHDLEAKLDAIRLGRAQLTPDVLDLLFRAVDVTHRLLVAEQEGKEPPVEQLEALLQKLRGTKRPSAAAPASEELDLDPSIFAVLTEYEEHRLRTNVEAGLRIYRLRVQFSLLTIDASLEQLKAMAKPHGEIITYLPTGEGTGADSIELDILMASKKTLIELGELLGSLGGTIIEVAKRSKRPAASPTSEPPELPVIEAGTSARAAAEAAIERPGTRPPAPVRKEAERRPQRTSSVPPPDEGKIATVRSVTQTVRVDIQKLDRLMNAVSELAIVKSSLDRLFERIRPASSDRRGIAELVRLSRTFDRQLEAMQQGILEVRMVPLGQLFERLTRVARQVGRNAKKQFNLVVTGAETEVDKLIVEELSDPLMHMMRNAIDHGIEPAMRRLAAGKPEVGTIALNAFQKGNHVLIELEDDGGGIDTERVLEVALQKGLINPADVRSTSRRDVLNLIFMPGLSTRAQAGEISGRGVGMDVVKTNIAKLGGVIDVQSEVGIGTKFAITLPITLAIIRVLVAEVEGHTFAIPLANVREAVQLSESDVFTVDGHEAMTLRGSTLRLARLSSIFELERGKRAHRSTKKFVVVTMAGSARIGLIVDLLVGGQDVVMKALGSSLRSVRGFAGAADLGEERLGLVLDTPSLYEEIVASDRRRGTVARPNG
ncbi:MAG: chemotaxis protein CheA [Polyangiaceae bacterium]|nr:chemotaxis protein CheA [Polyangiaceae bacterium]